MHSDKFWELCFRILIQKYHTKLTKTFSIIYFKHFLPTGNGGGETAEVEGGQGGGGIPEADEGFRSGRGGSGRS